MLQKEVKFADEAADYLKEDHSNASSPSSSVHSALDTPLSTEIRICDVLSMENVWDSLSFGWMTWSKSEEHTVGLRSRVQHEHWSCRSIDVNSMV